MYHISISFSAFVFVSKNLYLNNINWSKRVLEWKPAGKRIRGRPRKRWVEDIEEDIQSMGIRGWRKLSNERTEWRKITEKAKTE